MAAEKETELAHLLELREELRKRKRVLEVQLAQMGRMAPAHIKTELSDTHRQLEKLEQQITPPDTPAFLGRLSHEEQIRYLVALVMQLQKDFVDSWHLFLRRIKWFIVALIAAHIVTMLLALLR
jgi:hypothetical protein